MESRCRILTAAARVYAEFGFRGATTRRIATAAGVNEVTLFRTFGSKEALIEEALRHHAQSGAVSADALPEHPVDPERELTAWARAQLADLRAHRSLIRKTMSEIEERPDLAPTVTAGWATCDAVLHDYLGRLRAHGFVPADSAGELLAGGAMLMAALFSDAMGRDMLPSLFPQPEEEAPAVYVRLFLRAVACRAAAAPGPTDAPPAFAAAGPYPEPSSAR
jgi:AcrR family transcriptional regulator